MLGGLRAVLCKPRILAAARVSTYLVLAVLGVNTLAAQVNVNVYTRSYDTARSGANLQETILTPDNVNAKTFGKLWTLHTDGELYAQPLYVSNLTIAGGAHNVVFAASMRNTVYAVDANSGAVLWSQNFGTPIVAADVETDDNIVQANGGAIGIIDTPVIDPATNYMYFVSGEQPTGTYNYSYNLNAIDITTGLPVNGSPVAIAATYPTADPNTPLTFNAQFQMPRTGLALANGYVYMTFTSHEDQNNYNGWVMAYSASTLGQVAVYSDTTYGNQGGQGGIWCAGQAPSVDADGNIYISTGNGNFGATANNQVQTGNSFIKLSPLLIMLDYFTPSNSATMNATDQDLGSSGILLVPGTNYLLGGGKPGVLYLVDATNMGEFNASVDQVKQEFQAVSGVGSSHIHGGPIYFNSSVLGPSVFLWGENDVLRGFNFNATTGLLTTMPFATGTVTAPATHNDGAMPGGFLSLSANNNQTGIVWASTPYNADALHASVEGVLYAYDPNTLNLLWTDKTNAAHDDVGLFAKYVPPVVANGKMYIPNFGDSSTQDESGNLLCYGLLPQLTVNVANATMNAGTAVPTLSGAVTGLTNGDTLGTTVLVTYSTTATANSPDGTYPITATVAGSSAANYAVTVNAGTLTVTGTATQTITFPAIASQLYGSAPFAVSAASSLGSTYPVTISVQSGPATISGGIVTVNAVGTVILLATQAGDGQYGAATATQSFQVTPAPLSVTAANVTRAFGAANPPLSGTVTGAIGADSFAETFSTIATTSSNVGSYPIVPAVTGPLGNYTVTATNGTLTVVGTATTTAVSAPATATSGSSVTLTATVTSSAGTPGGNVTFTSGATALGTGTLAGGVASVNTTALPTGTDTVTATYTAAGNFAASSGTANLTVAGAPTASGTFAVAASPAALTVQTGQSVNTTLTLTPSGGYSGTIALICINLPANATCAFAQNSVTLIGNNQSATVSLIIDTTVQSASKQAPHSQEGAALLALAFWWPGGLTGLAVFARKRRSRMPLWTQLCLLLMCTCAFAAGLSGCGTSGSVAGGQTTSQVTVVTTGTSASGVTTESVALSLTVMQ